MKKNMEKINDVFHKICEFLNVKNQFECHNENFEECLKKICSTKFCKIVGLSGCFNCDSRFFKFFSSIISEALCEIFNVEKHVVSDELRLIKYEGINIVDEVKKYFLNFELDEAFLNSFELIDRFKYLMDYIDS